jgi:hypothetical protein
MLNCGFPYTDTRNKAYKKVLIEVVNVHIAFKYLDFYPNWNFRISISDLDFCWAQEKKNVALKEKGYLIFWNYNPYLT